MSFNLYNNTKLKTVLCEGPSEALWLVGHSNAPTRSQPRLGLREESSVGAPTSPYPGYNNGNMLNMVSEYLVCNGLGDRWR